MSSERVVLFDFDGVILKSAEKTISDVKKVFEMHELFVPKDGDFEGLLGLKIKDIIGNFVDDPVLLDKIYETYRDLTIKTVTEIPLFDGAKEVLETLKEKGYKLGLVTSRGGEGVIKLLDHYGFHEVFEVVIHRESITNHKPHPEGLNVALALLKASPQNAIYIGDMPSDAEASHNAGMDCLIITNGSSTFEVRGNVVFLETIGELPQYLDDRAEW